MPAAPAARAALLLGWPLLPLPDEGGRMAYPPLEQSVRELIEVILCTRAGEQLMRPRFGVGLDDFAQEPNTLTTRRRISDAIAAGLAQWEDRVIVDRIDVWEVPDRPAQVRVEIAYRLRRTGVAQQIAVGMPVGG